MLFFITDYYFPGSVALLVLLGITIVRHIQNKQEQSDAEAYQEEVRKLELQKLLESREERSLLEMYPEMEFWALIEKATKRAKPGYTFQLGVLRDIFSIHIPDDLIRIDNLYQKLITENISHDLTAAAAIIFKNGNIPTAVLLMNLFMMKGEVFFKNACHNPDLIIGKKIEHIEGRGLDDLLADLYYRKTGKLIPLLPDPDTPFELAGQPWKQRELPSRYAALWQAFA